jgi:glycosyltransferase involved in cell wall biosynthesis
VSAGLILHVNAETTWRGGENQVFLLASGMQQHRACAVACVPGSPLAERLTKSGVPIHVIPSDRGVRAIWALRRIIRQLKPAALHAHTSRAHQLCLIAALGSGLPVVVTRRVDFPLKRGPFAGWKYRGQSVRFVAISRAIQDVLLAGGVPAKRISVIPSGVDFALLDAVPPSDVRREFALPADALVVLNVAALSDHKDHATLLRAWVQIERAHPRAHLLIAGEGELRRELEELISSLGLQRARLVGYRSDVPGLLKGSDLFVMSSHLEGLCTSIMDAKRCGLPVVATRAGGIPEVVDEHSGGLLVPVRDPAALAHGLAVYLTDASRRQRDALIARQDSARFSADAMVRAYLEFYAAHVLHPGAGSASTTSAAT